MKEQGGMIKRRVKRRVKRRPRGRSGRSGRRLHSLSPLLGGVALRPRLKVTY